MGPNKRSAPALCLTALTALALASAAPPPRGAGSARASPLADAHPCPLAATDAPRPAELRGCAHAACTSLPNQLRVCGCVRDDQSVILVLREGRRIAFWPVGLFLGEEADLQAMHGDLDGDGSEELVVASRDSTSNGFEFSTWTVAIASLSAPERGVLTFHVQEYGEGTFFRRGEERGCGVLASERVWGEDAGGKPGTYFIAHPMRYRDGALAHDMSTPLLARRLLHSFVAERDRSLGRPHRLAWMMEPLSWVQSPKVETRAAEPLLDGYREEPRAVEGMIESVGPRPGLWETLALRLSTAKGRVDVCVGDLWQDRRERGCAWQLGDATTGRLLPPAYWPAAGASAYAKRSVRLVRYRRHESDWTLAILWLGAPPSTAAAGP